MENTELSKKLRELSCKSAGTYRKMICRMAAQRIGKLSAELEKTKALLVEAVADLRETDVNCTYCGYKHPPAPCSQDDEHYTCEDCHHDCHCKDCTDNSKWVWHKNKEERKWTII